MRIMGLPNGIPSEKNAFRHVVSVVNKSKRSKSKVA